MHFSIIIHSREANKANIANDTGLGNEQVVATKIGIENCTKNTRNYKKYVQFHSGLQCRVISVISCISVAGVISH